MFLQPQPGARQAAEAPTALSKRAAVRLAAAGTEPLTACVTFSRVGVLHVALACCAVGIPGTRTRLRGIGEALSDLRELQAFKEPASKLCHCVQAVSLESEACSAPGAARTQGAASSDVLVATCFTARATAC